MEYHLVTSALDDDAAYSNLVQLVQQFELLSPRLLRREATWVFCDRCGTSLDADLIHRDGHHYAEDGDFLCTDCWEQPNRLGLLRINIRSDV